MGSASVFVIFVLLCLTCFGVLSFVSARADLRLATQTAAAISDYYEADSRAVNRLREYEGLLDSVPHTVSGGRAACAQMIMDLDPSVSVGEDNSITFIEPIDSRRELAVTFEIAPPGSQGSRIRPVKWQVNAISDVQYSDEQELNLWQGMETMN